MPTTCQVKWCNAPCAFNSLHCFEHTREFDSHKQRESDAPVRILLRTAVVHKHIIELYGPENTSEKEAMNILAEIIDAVRQASYTLQFSNKWQVAIRNVSIPIQIAATSPRVFSGSRATPAA